MQRPWWENVPGILEERQGGRGGWSGVSEAGPRDEGGRSRKHITLSHVDAAGFDTVMGSRGRALSRAAVWSGVGLSCLPVAVVTTSHELGGLHPHKCILLQFWRPTLPNQFELKVRCVRAGSF